MYMRRKGEKEAKEEGSRANYYLLRWVENEVYTPNPDPNPGPNPDKDLEFISERNFFDNIATFTICRE